MKKFSLSVGFVGLSLLVGACGGSSDEPLPFGTSNDLAAKLAADLGCPFHVDVEPGRVFIAAQGSSRVLAAPNEQGVGPTVRDFVARYSADLGAHGDRLRVVGEGRDASNVIHVAIAPDAPAEVDTNGYGLEVVLDPEGRLLGVVGHTALSADFAPKVTMTEALDVAHRALTKDTEPEAELGLVPEARLELVTIAGDEEPRLAYRVDFGAKAAWVDAHTGEVVSVSNGISGLQAEAATWQAYSTIVFPQSDKKARIDYEPASSGVALSRPSTGASFWSKPKSRIVLTSLRGIQRGAPVTAPIVGSRVEDLDRGIPLPAAANQKPSLHDGLAVNAMAQVARVEEYFQNRMFASPSRRLRYVAGVPSLVDDPIEVVVHANYSDADVLADPTSTGDLRSGAGFVNGTTRVMIGDGDAALLPQDPNADRSVALSTDAVAHELTHMWIDTKFAPGEVGSIQEGVADVVGQLVEHEVAEATGKPSRPDRLGESSFIFTTGLRYLARPDAYSGPHGVNAWHSHRRSCLLKDKKTHGIVFDSHGQPKLDLQLHVHPPKAARLSCDHENATVVGHAFYLMTLGGQNALSDLIVRNPIGWEASRALWLGMIVKVPTARGLKTLLPMTLDEMAKRQLATARMHSPSVANAVGCAWEAVGVLASGTTAQVSGTGCTAIARITCANRPNGVYCDEMQPFSATRCENGHIAVNPPQCGGEKHCRPVGGLVTNQAEMVSPTTLRCFNASE